MQWATDTFSHDGRGLDPHSDCFDQSGGTQAFRVRLSSGLRDLHTLFANTPGSAALEIGIDALERAAEGEIVLTEPLQILNIMLSALRSPDCAEHAVEIVLASVAAWARADDLGEDVRMNILTLIEAALAGVDQHHMMNYA